jgi:hypothetical protein
MFPDNDRNPIILRIFILIMGLIRIPFFLLVFLFVELPILIIETILKFILAMRKVRRNEGGTGSRFEWKLLTNKCRRIEGG